MKNRINTLLLIPIFFFFINPLHAQLTLNTAQNASDLVNNILGDGVTVTGATLVCPDGASASFAGGNTTVLGVDQGVLLTSGAASVALGPNDSSGAGQNNNAPGDGDLSNISDPAGLVFDLTTYDACVLVFDFIPEGTSISFNYVFASEEYNEFYCTQYNDVFGFLVSGPNPGGGNYVNENLAILNGTSVSINSVGPGACQGIDNSAYHTTTGANPYVQYDGYLNVLTASIDLVPCQTYSIKIGIADRGDHILDSGVFIEAGSFVSTAIEATAAIEATSCLEAADGEIDLTVTGGLAPFDYSWSNGDITEDIDNLTTGDYTVQVLDANGCVKSFTFNVPIGVDDVPPTIMCTDITVNVDGDGNASVTADDLATASDICGETELTIDRGAFSCLLIDYTILVTAEDESGNTATCEVIVTLAGPDADCDTVTDACDLCDGGDDTVDNDNDGYPDCAFPPAFEDIIPEWICAKNKVYMCHIPPGNPDNRHTICVSKNAIPGHMAHGDYLGPCGNASCIEEFVDEGFELRSNHLAYSVFPNPAENTIFVNLNALEKASKIYLYNELGEQLYAADIPVHSEQFTLDVSNPNYTSGLYFISIISDEEIESFRVIIQK